MTTMPAHSCSPTGGMALRQQGFHDAACGVLQLGARVGRRISDVARRSDGAVRVTRRSTSQFFGVICLGVSALGSPGKPNAPAL